MKWIDSTKLSQWADKKECEGLLPELIRRLIIASNKNLLEISIPSGDSIYKPGWDGRCVCDIQSLYVPKGLSFWEFGRNVKAKEKANSDFAKRNNLCDQDYTQATFIFVTPRRVSNKAKWIEERKLTAYWRDVKLYDGDDLECWIEQCSSVGSWLAKELQVYTKNIESSTAFWKHWTANPQLDFTPELIISGRVEEQQKIQDFLIETTSGVIEIQASSKEEAIGFIIASALNKDEITAEIFSSKALIIYSKEALKEIVSQNVGLFIIYSSEADEFISASEVGSNVVFTIISFKVKSNGISIPIPKWSNFTQSLVNSGLDRDKSSNLCKECGRSFTVLRRLFSNSPGRVEWNEGNDELALLPMFFIQKFNEYKEGDISLVQQFSREEFHLYKIKLKRWSLISDTPIYQIGEYWRLVSQYDFLYVVAKFITEEHLDLFEKVFFEVLGEINPALDLEPKLRFAAALFKKSSIKYSEWLREGLCQTLLLLAVHGENSGINVNYSIQKWADEIVNKLLENKQLSFWQSIQNKLHILAEVSPNSFLNCLEGLIKKEPNVISAMFDDSNYDLFTPSYHTHILWALESLAWEQSYLTRVSLVLADLVLLDSGSKLSNRPINTLKHIFLPWLPQTYASITVRHQVIKTLIKKRPSVGFQLLKAISPNHHGFGSYNYKPIWRLRDYSYIKASTEEYNENLSFICENLIELVGCKAKMWAEIIEFIDNYTEENRIKLISALSEVENFDGNISLLIEKLREFIQRHDDYSEEEWAIELDELNQLKNIYTRITSNEVDRYYWYFNVDTIDNRRTEDLTYEQARALTDQKRFNLLKSILRNKGLDGIKDLASKVDLPERVGFYLADVEQSLEKEIMEHLSTDYNALHYLAVGYIGKLSDIRGIDWIRNIADGMSKSNSNVLIDFFLSVNATSQLWDLLEEKYGECEEKYWKGAFTKRGYRNFFHLYNTDEQIRCIKTLNKYKRYLTSIDLIRYERKEAPVNLIIETLEGLVTNPIEEDVKVHSIGWSIKELFKRLDEEKVEDRKMQRLEWYYLDVLINYHHERPVKYLIPELKSNPIFFAEIISFNYLPENRAPDEEISGLDISFVQNRGLRAKKLLELWDDFPGETQDGMDYEKLKRWILLAIEECSKKDRRNRGMYQIGKILGKTYENKHSRKWPDEELCEIIEELEKEELDNGFVSGIIEGRGIKHLISGDIEGKLEKVKAENFKALASSVSFSFPKVAGLINRVADHYLRIVEFQRQNRKKEEFED
ncbi:MAG: hypothetical protein J7604_25960 [Sporocytophaga sp.]|uniref:hypothetical protein n=1 Tax=Sporocytophaga sp. TaxID=2231183 RepID=UPI001AFFAE4E|nr:hypothetical protein [Sporocytophaga sp.]MBO9703677.1 hypothetical protein [Sporocytophaga sp.]